MVRRTLLSVALMLLVAPAAFAQKAPPPKPVVLVAGATGKNGSAILDVLKDAPFTVRAMTRDKVKAIEKFGSAVDWVEADVTKPETLAPALKGVSYVIDAVAATGLTGETRPEEVDFHGTENLAAAAKAVGVKRFVIITSSVSGAVDHPMNKRGADVLIYKGKAEEALIASGVPYVIIGPSGMTNEPRGQKDIKLIPRAEYKSGTSITRGDVGLVALEALTNPDAANRAFSVSNADSPSTPAWKKSFATLPRK